MGMKFVCASRPPAELGDNAEWDVAIAGGVSGRVEVRKDSSGENYIVSLGIPGVQVCYGLSNQGDDRHVIGMAESKLLGLAGVK
jgi:hypothetical protein